MGRTMAKLTVIRNLHQRFLTASSDRHPITTVFMQRVWSLIPMDDVGNSA